MVTSTRELTEDESESFEVEGLPSAFSGVFEVEGASSDFSGSFELDSSSFESFPITDRSLSAWLAQLLLLWGFLCRKNIYDVFEYLTILVPTHVHSSTHN